MSWDNKAIVVILATTLLLTIVNTVLLSTILFLRSNERVIIVTPQNTMFIAKPEKNEVILLLRWTLTEGHYMLTLPKKLITDKGAILEVVQKINFSNTRIEPPTVVKFFVKAKIISGKVNVGDRVKTAPDIITIPEAALPSGVVVYIG